jgi:hypothetical protein
LLTIGFQLRGARELGIELLAPLQSRLGLVKPAGRLMQPCFGLLQPISRLVESTLSVPQQIPCLVQPAFRLTKSAVALMKPSLDLAEPLLKPAAVGKGFVEPRDRIGTFRVHLVQLRLALIDQGLQSLAIGHVLRHALELASVLLLQGVHCLMKTRLLGRCLHGRLLHAAFELAKPFFELLARGAGLVELPQRGRPLRRNLTHLPLALFQSGTELLPVGRLLSHQFELGAVLLHHRFEPFFQTTALGDDFIQLQQR